MTDLLSIRACGPDITPRLAEASIPYQCWEQPYPPAEGLTKGTIFPSLHKAGMLQWEGGGSV